MHTEPYVLGIDPGNSDTTGVLQTPHGLRQTLTFPSVVGSGRLNDLKRVRSGIGGGGLDDDEFVLEADGLSHFVGALAQREGNDPTSQRGDPARYGNGHATRLFRTLAAALIPEAQATVQVVTGLPVRVWSEEHAARFKQALLGHHEFVFNGSHRRITVSDVTVLMEGAGVIIAHGTAEQVAQAALDIGGHTTELFQSVGMKPVSARCAALPVGVAKVGELTQHEVAKMGRHLTDGEINAMLHAVARRDTPEVWHNGARIDVLPIVLPIIESVAAEIASFVSKNWRTSEQSGVASDVARVVLAGGGAHFFAPQMQAIIPHLRVAPAPERANAEGYLAFGLARQKRQQRSGEQVATPALATG